MIVAVRGMKMVLMGDALETIAQRGAAGVPSTDMADQVGFRLRFAHGAVWKDLLSSFRPFGLKPQHYAAMSIILARPGVTQLDLSVAMGLQGSNLVTLLDALAKPGLIERRQKESDRRSNGLFITAAGMDLLDRMNAAQRQHEARMAALLTADQQAMLVALLRRLEAISNSGA